MFKHAIHSTTSAILQNPLRTVGSLVFILGFTMISANALFSQHGNHPGPIWMTRTQDGFTTKAIPNKRTARLKAHSVLTQRISLRNVPVPTLNPKQLENYDGSSPLLVEIQEALVSAGYYSGTVDGIYGRESRAAILKFQTKTGLKATGEPSGELLASLKNETKPQAPTSSQDAQLVKLIQTGLSEYGRTDITVDGIFGSRTEDAIRDFQKRYKLAIDGRPSRAVLDKLSSIGALKKG